VGPTQKVIPWLAVILCAFLAEGLLSDSVPIRVLTYNIHHGRGTDGRVDLERIARVIRASEADLVALQEVDRRTTRSDGVDQADRLATLTGLNAAFGKAIDFGGGEYGVAVLSRFEIVASRTHALPSSADREQRVALDVRVRLASREELTFVSTHFDHTRDATDRVAQANSINELFATRKPGPVIVAGDLNATPLTAEMKLLGGAWLLAAGESPAPTFPAEKPTRKIDYVLLRRADAWKVNRTRVMKEPVASDHAPLLVELQHVTTASETGKQSRVDKGVLDEHGFLVHEVSIAGQADGLERRSTCLSPLAIIKLRGRLITVRK
jgi:endonuclease/exonuclease/phosphatase family metal-dependent hydrolase